ncbi:hypothetical protein, partial [Serratia marcescens]|uniref:hypothetical protein n=1 Tax=Serratia marcescens TaxID=615 RepID=UPI001CA32388
YEGEKSVMEESKKVLIIDEDENGKITSDEIIGLTSESIRSQQKNDLAKKADKYVKKQLEIKAKKERIMDKSFEL